MHDSPDIDYLRSSTVNDRIVQRALREIDTEDLSSEEAIGKTFMDLINYYRYSGEFLAVEGIDSLASGDIAFAARERLNAYRSDLSRRLRRIVESPR